MSTRIRPVDPREFEPPAPRVSRAGRQPALTREVRIELKRRYAVYERNKPAQLCAEYGISKATLDHIVSGHRYRDER